MAAPVATPTADWHSWYESRLVSEYEAAAQVQRGDHVFVPMGAGGRATPILAALQDRIDEVEPIMVTNSMSPDPVWYEDELAAKMRFNIIFASPANREPVNTHAADYTPWMVFGAHKALEEGRDRARSMDVAIIAVGPPNEHGFCCFGAWLWDGKKAARMARTTIAIVVPDAPHTYGDTWLHVSEIDWFVPSEALQVFAGPATEQPWDRPIAEHVSTLVRDGDTLQIGTGASTGALANLGAFDRSHDLGWFSELTIPGTIDLVKKGIITSRRMSTHPGKVINTMMGNSASDVAYVADNPIFELYSTDYVHHPAQIARNDNMLAINGAVSVDLTGQIAAGQIGTRVWSGTGGQLAYVIGAYMSRGGRSVTVMPATASSGSVSRIVPQFSTGQVVTVPRDLADIVVTEFGIAHLLNKTQRERAEELIAVAHPDFRAELRLEAAKLYGA